MNPYELKQETRRARLMSASAAAFARADAAGRRVRAISSAIPFGQPVLVGHHSERHHRRDIARMDAGIRTSIDETKRGEELQRRAESVGSGGISQDDPDAIAKLEGELSAAERAQAMFKAINATIRKYARKGTDAQVAALTGLEYGIGEARARLLLEPDTFGHVGIAPYKITNNGANIRRIQKRIAELRAKATTPAREPIVTDRYTIEECADDNRTRIRFVSRQGASIVSLLKSRGFRWAPSVDAWQRQRSNGAWYAATEIARAVDAT